MISSSIPCIRVSGSNEEQSPLSTPLQIDEPTFLLPVDGEHKAKMFRPYLVKGVHMRAFHASWLSFFASFLATFAPAAVLPIVREDLNLTGETIGYAGVASVSGAVFGRIVMGTVCDTIGPRFGHASLMLLTAPSVAAMTLITGPTGFIITRFVVGLSLASFVACQVSILLEISISFVSILIWCMKIMANLKFIFENKVHFSLIMSMIF